MTPAVNYAERLTAKQLGYIRQACKRLGTNANTESIKMFGCVADKLNRRQAADLLKELETK